MPPMFVLVSPLEGASMWMIVYFLVAIDARKKLFEEDLVEKEGDL